MEIQPPRTAPNQLSPWQYPKRWEDNRVSLWTGDLTQQDVDAIVNAANATLLGGGGVDGAIHAAAGPALLNACRKVREVQYPGGLPTGEAVMTESGNLPAKAVIHTVGPIFGAEKGQEANLLAKSYLNSLKVAAENGFTSIAFPAVSTGAYGFPETVAAKVASQAIHEFLKTNQQITDIRLVFFRPEALDVFLENHCFE